MTQTLEARREVCPEKVSFFEAMYQQRLSLGYGDVEILQRDGLGVDLTGLSTTSKFSTNVELQVPIVSAAMDDITERSMAIAMASIGGLGIIHAGLSIEDQKREVRRVKHHVYGVVYDPVTVHMDRTLESIFNEADETEYAFKNFPVVDSDKKFVGILESHNFDFTDTVSLSQTAGELMRPSDPASLAYELLTPEQALQMMKANRTGLIPLIDPSTGRLTALYTSNDVGRALGANKDRYNVDDKGRLRVGAAFSTNDEALIERITEIMGKDRFLDVAVLDTSNGGMDHVYRKFDEARNEFPDLDIVPGNMIDPKTALHFKIRGANGAKAGVGVGSICSTTGVTGVGKPQVTAVYDIFRAVDDSDFPVCADGGVVNAGDIAKAIVAGADTVMVGGFVSATDETPGKPTLNPETNELEKDYGGMASPRHLRQVDTNKRKASTGRYKLKNEKEVVAQGVDKKVKLRGPVSEVIEIARLALISAMEQAKAKSIADMKYDASFTRITEMGKREAAVHDV